MDLRGRVFVLQEQGSEFDHQNFNNNKERRLLDFILTITFILCVCVYTCTHKACVKVRGQLIEAHSLSTM